MIQVLFSLRLEADFGIGEAPRPLLDYGPSIGLAHRGAVSTRSRSIDYDINLSFDWVGWVRLSVSLQSPVGVVSSPLDIMIEVSLADQVFDLVLYVPTLLSVVAVFMMETTISAPVPFLGMGLDAIWER
ncbi:hypothetical protein B296_00032689 [Ensete ventricosum]|uniref:Uncharacterized protein n=1 Tax=Ensete ventricosum TaxID=4639 RepID=A0A427ACW4_ENSVE|nr:hypothetical protein B296_00032689 [Ensete ventricosum]